VPDENPISDAELTALALAADPERPLADDAVPFDGGDRDHGLLPAWYMPSTAGGRCHGVRRLLLGGLVVALVAISACGLCVTYGIPEIPL
jgi:hypothetical protein